MVRKLVALVFAISIGFGAVACKEKSAMEKAGDAMEDAADDVGDAAEDLADDIDDKME